MWCIPLSRTRLMAFFRYWSILRARLQLGTRAKITWLQSYKFPANPFGSLELAKTNLERRDLRQKAHQYRTLDTRQSASSPFLNRIRIGEGKERETKRDAHTTPTFILSGCVSARKASVTPRMGSRGAGCTCFHHEAVLINRRPLLPPFRAAAAIAIALFFLRLNPFDLCFENTTGLARSCAWGCDL